jgi:hypothetical protein
MAGWFSCDPGGAGNAETLINFGVKMSGRLKQKLFEALSVLVGDGELDTRLTHAVGYLSHLLDTDIPDEYRNEFGTVSNAWGKNLCSPYGARNPVSRYG